MSATVLTVDGLVASPRNFTYDDLTRLAAECQVADISRFSPKRRGDGVLLKAILSEVMPSTAGFWLTFHASRDDFAASVPADPGILETGVVVYSLDGAPLPVEQGGPVRFLIPDPAACKTAELDECANVKFVDRIEITAERGRDTRPDDEAEHAELHRRQEQG